MERLIENIDTITKCLSWVAIMLAILYFAPVVIAAFWR